MEEFFLKAEHGSSELTLGVGDDECVIIKADLQFRLTQEESSKFLQKFRGSSEQIPSFSRLETIDPQTLVKRDSKTISTLLKLNSTKGDIAAFKLESEPKFHFEEYQNLSTFSQTFHNFEPIEEFQGDIQGDTLEEQQETEIIIPQFSGKNDDSSPFKKARL
jgi:hypothetical protein